MKSIYIKSYSVEERDKDERFADETNCEPCFCIIQNTDGECEITMNGGEAFSVPERSVVIIPSYKLARVKHKGGKTSGKRKELRLKMDVIADGCKLEDIYSFPYVLPAEENEKVFVLLNTIKDNDNIYRAYSNLYRLLELMMRYGEVKHERYFLSDIYEYIISNCNKQIKVGELAKFEGVSEPSVYRMFAAVAGCTPIDYINGYRIGKARRLLATEEKMKIKQVASECGFDDQLYFSKVFSKTYGESPRAFRESLKPMKPTTFVLDTELSTWIPQEDLNKLLGYQ